MALSCIVSEIKRNIRKIAFYTPLHTTYHRNITITFGMEKNKNDVPIPDVEKSLRIGLCLAFQNINLYYLAIQRSVWRDIKFAFFVCLFVRLRISQRRMVRSA